MGKVKHTTLKNLPVKAAFMLYMVVSLLAALVLSFVVMATLANVRTEIVLSYIENADDIDEWEADFILATDATYVHMSGNDSFLLRIILLANFLTIPVCFILSIVLAGVLFYRNKLKKPIEILDAAAARIAENDLDFYIEYDRTDEMGRLCRSFEKTRYSLLENNREMWRQMEERKRLNAAFSHDLRTPLTVLKAHSQMIIKYMPENKISIDDIYETMCIMDSNITRLESYVMAMSDVQRLEDIPINPQFLNDKDVKCQLYDTTEILFSNLAFEFCSDTKGHLLNLDIEIVMRVYENILSNTIRYAEKKVSITLSYYDGYFSISVSDDGKGFTPDGLLKSTKPFFKENKHLNNGHYGLGLNICKILCERHGGGITIANNENCGAKVTVSFFAK